MARPSGSWTSSHSTRIGAVGYAASMTYCAIQALAVGGEGTATRMDEKKAPALEAGFGHVRRADFPNNPFNLFYEIRA